jgi:glycosyltransferase involved in cell wall biosynthesis
LIVLQADAGREWRGGQNQVRLLCRELLREDVAPRGLRVVLITGKGGELGQRAAAAGVEVREVQWVTGLDPRAIMGARAALNELRPDVVHAHDSHALSVMLAASLMAQRGQGDSQRASWKLVATRRVDFHIGRWSAWRRVHHIVAISAAVRDVLIADGIPADRITIIPSGIDPDEVRHAAGRPLDIRGRLGLPSDTPIAANVAALVAHKDQHTLIRAAAAARPARPDLHWVVAGEGELRATLEADVATLGMRDRIHFIGHLDQAHALIREANVVVMSSRQEGLGSVVLEALAIGTPVVATAGGGLPEIVPPEALARVGDAETLAQKTLEALATKRATALPPRYTAAAMAKNVVALYRSLF